ncbi:membrane-associated Zn-dependent protease 1, partial [mine drainage metagenome]
MGQKNEIKTFLKEASSLIAFNAEEVGEDSAVLVLKSAADLDVAGFRTLLEVASRNGFDIFTGPEGSSRIYVSRKFEKARTWSFSFKIKVALALAAIISTYYVGYEYQLAYSPSGDMTFLLSYVTVFFVVPIALIIIAREAGRYLAMKTDGIHYSFPIIMPDPMGVGIIGSVISQHQPFVTKKCML